MEFIDSRIQQFTKLFYRRSFCRSPTIDRTKLAKGHIVSWNKLISSSTSWRLAMEACPSFASKSKSGTMLLFKLKTKKLISSLSQYPYDSEVIITPLTKFKVTNWYHGNIIALGQANIR